MEHIDRHATTLFLFNSLSPQHHHQDSRRANKKEKKESMGEGKEEVEVVGKKSKKKIKKKERKKERKKVNK